MKKLSIILSLIVPMALIFSGCQKDKGTGTLKLSLTDAPADAEDVTGVWITFSDIQYHISGNNWASFTDFVGPQKYNLLELTRGESAILGELELEPGTYTQLRFILDAPTFGMGNPSNPGCYLEFEDESTIPLFVPSGAQTGYKGVGAFTVPVNGTVEVTADFDVRKSVVKAGMSGIYILKPTIRLIVNNQSGQIAGSITNIPENTQVAIYVYEDGAYTGEEANDPEPEMPRFPNATSSDMVDEEGGYHIAYLAPITYDLVVAAFAGGEFQEVLGIVEDVPVESNKTTVANIDLDEL